MGLGSRVLDGRVLEKKWDEISEGWRANFWELGAFDL